MHPIVEKIVKDGLSSVNTSMLSAELRNRMMTEAGSTLMNLRRYKEAGQALAIADNKELLKEQGRWFLKQNNFGLAAYFLLHVEREEMLHDLAEKCIASGNIDAAQEIYRKLGDETMLLFLKENLS